MDNILIDLFIHSLFQNKCIFEFYKKRIELTCTLNIIFERLLSDVPRTSCMNVQDMNVQDIIKTYGERPKNIHMLCGFQRSLKFS